MLAQLQLLLVLVFQFYTGIRPDVDIWHCQSLYTKYKESAGSVFHSKNNTFYIIYNTSSKVLFSCQSQWKKCFILPESSRAALFSPGRTKWGGESAAAPRQQHRGKSDMLMVRKHYWFLLQTKDIINPKRSPTEIRAIYTPQHGQNRCN